jgi:outer membrane receptor protein involved in Fe transport
MGGGPARGRASVGFSVAAEQTDRFLDPVHPDNLHNSGGVLSGEAHLSFASSDTSLFRLNASGGRSRYDVPHGETQESAGQEQRQRLLQDAQSASWQRFWSATTVSHAAFYRRRVATNLRGSPADTPLSALSDRTHSRLGALASITHQKGRHTFKTGFEAARLALGEQFSFAVTDPTETDEAEISEAAAQFTRAAPFKFRDDVDRMQWALYMQDSVRATSGLTIDLGIRFDRTRLLLSASQWSPRLGLAYAWPSAGTTLRASVNRFFQPPQPEHLLLSSSPQARALSPFADDDVDSDDGGADLEPERQTAWEIGMNRWFSGLLRLDAAYWQRHVRNYADPNVFFGTTIIFPNSVAEGLARGLDIRVDLPKYRRWSTSVSYTLAKVEQVGPINGGLFLESNITEIGPGTRFTPDHDQRHGAATTLTYHEEGRGLLASAVVRYDSGTPLEVDEDDRDELMERPGASMVNFETGRVRARTLVDLMLSKTMHRGRRTTTSVRLGVFNVTDREYALNFGNPFSGTHFGARRSMRLDVSVELN